VFAGVVTVAGVGAAGVGAVVAATGVAATGVAAADVAAVVGGNDPRIDWFMAFEIMPNPCVAIADCISENIPVSGGLLLLGEWIVWLNPHTGGVRIVSFGLPILCRPINDPMSVWNNGLTWACLGGGTGGVSTAGVGFTP